MFDEGVGERYAESDGISMTNLKRLGWYLRTRPQLAQLFVEWTSTASVARLDVCGDSDHARCLETPKSMTGVVFVCSAHCLKVSSHTQSTISLRSGDSECDGWNCQMRSHWGGREIHACRFWCVC